MILNKGFIALAYFDVINSKEASHNRGFATYRKISLGKTAAGFAPFICSTFGQAIFIWQSPII